ncbi:MAG: YpdA family putative bacillithiol disulfide reductase [Balneolaceae bacterium]|nr:MAG: YpdA family putative bacillithiol disulfide reductase [Balneolaceae bacterium]
MVIIIGAGPIGLACAIELKQRNVGCMVIEKGCLVNSIFNYPTNMTFFSTSDKIEIGGIPFISHGPKPTRREALEYYRRVYEHYKLDVRVYEAVQNLERTGGRFTVTTSKAVYQADKLILATGFFDIPHRMDVPGENLPKVKHYFDEPHPYAGLPVLVVGAGNSAVDVALECYRCGSDVTMVIREAEIKKSVKYWVRPDIENRIHEGSIRAYFNSRVVEIREHEVVLATPEGERVQKNDFVFAMTGYEPNYKLLEMAGVAFNDDEFRTPVFDQKNQMSNVEGIYLAGVVCGGLHTGKWFIENSIVHAGRIAYHITDSKKRILK